MKILIVKKNDRQIKIALCQTLQIYFKIKPSFSGHEKSLTLKPIIDVLSVLNNFQKIQTEKALNYCIIITVIIISP